MTLLPVLRAGQNGSQSSD